jgi:RNA polymerase sigma-70 factor (ECF subfamily)
MARADPREVVRRGLTELWPRLWRYCVVVTGNPERAGDAAQAACLRALERADQFTPGTDLDRWVFRIAQRLWLNEMRSEAVRRGGGMAPVDEFDLPDPGPDAETRMHGRQVMAGVMHLPEAQRVTVLLVYVEGYAYREAADILDIPIGTVMSRLAAARSTLSIKLKDQKDITA